MSLIESQATRGLTATENRDQWRPEVPQRQVAGIIPSLPSGPSRLTTSVCKLEDAEVVCVTAPDRLDMTGRTRKDVVTVVQPAVCSRIWLNGYRLSAGDVLALPAHHPFAMWSSDNCRVVLLLIRVDDLATSPYLDRSAAKSLLNGEPVHADSSVRPSRPSGDKGGPTGTGREGSRFAPLKADSEEFDYRWHWRDRNRLYKTPEAAFRVLNDSVRYIDLKLAGRISIADVSEAAATSVSKLERVFRNEIGLSPSRYVRARRLIRARYALQDLDSEETTVASVALDSGFNHLGRFAGAYRELFGELPSETLKANGKALHPDFELSHLGPFVRACEASFSALRAERSKRPFG